MEHLLSWVPCRLIFLTPGLGSLHDSFKLFNHRSKGILGLETAFLPPVEGWFMKNPIDMKYLVWYDYVYGVMNPINYILGIRFTRDPRRIGLQAQSTIDTFTINLDEPRPINQLADSAHWKQSVEMLLSALLMIEHYWARLFCHHATILCWSKWS